MTVFVKQVRITDPHSPFNGSRKDILVENGIITRISDNGEPGSATVIHGENAFIAPGFTDIFSQFGEPGSEQKETLETGIQAALAGGYTQVCLLPNTQPALHNKPAIEYIRNRNTGSPVTLLPYGAITLNTEGKELAEMIDMRQGGAIAYTDGINSLQSAGILLKALQYVKTFNGVVVQLPNDKSISGGGLVNEGLVSTRMGLPGMPAIAEELMLERDAALAAYTGSRIHFTGISTAESVNIVARTRKTQPALTCSVTPYHLWFTDEDLQHYNTHYKLNPPLRTATDRNALREAVLNGTVDCVASHHQPHEWDMKQCEFQAAAWGMEALESCFRALASLPGITPERIVELLSINPRKIFDLPVPVIREGEPCSATIFSMEGESRFTEADIRSRSRNNGFIGQVLKGRIVAVLHNAQTTVFHAG